MLKNLAYVHLPFSPNVVYKIAVDLPCSPNVVYKMAVDLPFSPNVVYNTDVDLPFSPNVVYAMTVDLPTVFRESSTSVKSSLCWRTPHNRPPTTGFTMVSQPPALEQVGVRTFSHTPLNDDKLPYIKDLTPHTQTDNDVILLGNMSELNIFTLTYTEIMVHV